MSRSKLIIFTLFFTLSTFVTFANDATNSFENIKKSTVQIVISVPDSSEKTKWSAFIKWFKNAKGAEKKTVVDRFKVSGVNPVVVASGFIVSNTNNNVYIATVLKAANLNELVKNEILFVKGTKNSGLDEISSVEIVPTKESVVTLLKVKLVKKNTVSAILADSSKYMSNAEGTQIYGIGYPTERISIDTYESSPTINNGIISSTAKDLGGVKGSLVQTNLIINNGMYGGPLTNANGEVVGILDNIDNNESAVVNTLLSLLNQESGTAEPKVGTSYAIPIKKVKEELDTLNIQYMESSANVEENPVEKTVIKTENTAVNEKETQATVMETQEKSGGSFGIIVGAAAAVLALTIFIFFKIKNSGETQSSAPSIKLTDMGSSNGTFINNVKVQSNSSMLLKNGDIIRLCSDGPEFMVNIDNGGRSLKCTKGDNSGRQFKIPSGGITIGRESADIIESNEGKVSRLHVKIS